MSNIVDFVETMAGDFVVLDALVGTQVSALSGMFVEMFERLDETFETLEVLDEAIETSEVLVETIETLVVLVETFAEVEPSI